jgi:hypothetical protein
MSNLHEQLDDRLPLHYTQYHGQVQNEQETDLDKFRRFFYNRAQEQTETADEFHSELERLALGARFDLEMTPDVVEKLIRDR